jgi:hypothetical protein
MVIAHIVALGRSGLLIHQRRLFGTLPGTLSPGLLRSHMLGGTQWDEALDG